MTTLSDKLAPGRLERWLRKRRIERTLQRYGGIQWCPWCKQCAQDGNTGWRFDPSKDEPMFDVLTCGICGGTSLWLWGMGMHFQRALSHPILEALRQQEASNG